MFIGKNNGKVTSDKVGSITRIKVVHTRTGCTK